MREHFAFIRMAKIREAGRRKEEDWGAVQRWAGKQQLSNSQTIQPERAR